LYEEELGRKIKHQMELNQLLELDKKDEMLVDEDINKGKMNNISIIKRVTESIIRADEDVKMEL